jgi:DnaJ-class molecular chaperone
VAVGRRSTTTRARIPCPVCERLVAISHVGRVFSHKHDGVTCDGSGRMSEVIRALEPVKCPTCKGEGVIRP